MNETDKILYRVIEICNWCKHTNLTCEKCNDLYGACRRNMTILDLRKYFQNEVEVEKKVE